MARLIVQGDAARLPLADESVDLVFGSPPYADARSYGIGGQRHAGEWVEWMLQVTSEACRVSRGLVLWVAAGVTRDWCYWPCCEGLMWEWFRRGNRLWRPAYWHRVGIPGSGGRQWLRSDVEYVLAFTRQKSALPWADNTANGHPPRWAPGGEMSYRLSDGQRRNDDPWMKRGRGNNLGGRTQDGRKKLGTRKAVRRCTRGKAGGDTIQEDSYTPPKLANPGNLVRGIPVGGGMLGHRLAHENEAPFPQKLAEWFLRGWCPPGGTVLDPFSGSGTTVAAALAMGMIGIGIDIRASQCQLSLRRTDEVQRVIS